MSRRAWVGGALVVASACGDLGEPPRAVTVPSIVPPPFALQFVGRYSSGAPPSASFGSLELSREGDYRVASAEGALVAHGGFVAGSGHELPLTLESTDGDPWTATVLAYDGRIVVVREGETITLRATAPVGPVEALCSATGGRWLDDDSDPRTGLYCVCPPPHVYLPSAGGCVR